HSRRDRRRPEKIPHSACDQGHPRPYQTTGILLRPRWQGPDQKRTLLTATVRPARRQTHAGDNGGRGAIVRGHLRDGDRRGAAMASQDWQPWLYLNRKPAAGSGDKTAWCWFWSYPG